MDDAVLLESVVHLFQITVSDGDVPAAFLFVKVLISNGYVLQRGVVEQKLIQRYLFLFAVFVIHQVTVTFDLIDLRQVQKTG